MHDRLVPLEGVVNFRDFGGYARVGGGRVRRGQLYRSAHFAAATDPDICQLDALGIKTVLDLRRPDERSLEPNRWPGAAARTIANDEGQEAVPPHTAILFETDLTAPQVEAYMTEVYRTYPFEPRYTSLFAAYFATLLEHPGTCSVVHCAAGKDRTGMLCALTLLALEVHPDDVMADYLMTNQAVDVAARMPHLKVRLEERLGRTVNAEALLPMLGVRESFLRTALETIIARRGSVEAYMDQELGLTPALRQRLRAQLLED